MNSEGDFRIEKPFEARPPRLKDLVNQYVMGDVWLRDSPFGPVTDSLVLAKKFQIEHKNILRAISKCREELEGIKKFEIDKNFFESFYKGGAAGKERKARKVEITEFGLALLLLYINTPAARLVSAEIIYRFFILKTYIKGLTESQVGALRGYCRKRME